MYTAAVQILLNSLISGLVLSLVAIGFTYIFRVTKVFHLAHGAVYVAGALSWWQVVTITNSWVAGIFAATGLVVLLIYTIEKAVYLPLNRKQSNQSISLIASMGVYVVVVNILALLFGSENKTVVNLTDGTSELGSLILTRVQIIQAIVGILAILAFFCYLKFTKLNLRMKSVSDNETISKAFGIDTERVRLCVFIVGSILATIAAILKTIEVGTDPYAGMSVTLTAAVVAILVSRLNVFVITAFSIVLILLQNYVEWFLNAQWMNGFTFLILLSVILFRTEGIVSYNLRKDRI